MNLFTCLLWMSGAGVLALGISQNEVALKKHQSLEEARDHLRSTVEDLKLRVEDLSREMTKITQSPHYAKKILRERFNMTKEGETMMFFEDE